MTFAAVCASACMTSSNPLPVPGRSDLTGERVFAARCSWERGGNSACQAASISRTEPQPGLAVPLRGRACPISSGHHRALQGQMAMNDSRIAPEGTALPACRCHVRLGVRNVCVCVCTGFTQRAGTGLSCSQTPWAGIALCGVGVGTFPIAFPIYPHLQPRGGSGYQLWRWFKLTRRLHYANTGSYSALCRQHGGRMCTRPSREARDALDNSL